MVASVVPINRAIWLRLILSLILSKAARMAWVL
jgi:hypothetical protein